MKQSMGDLWRTPKEPFNTLNKEFMFLADMACSNKNKLCRIGFTEEDDSLSFDWYEAIFEEFNVDTSVGWFAEALKGVSEIRNVIADEKESGGYSSGRLAFLNGDGNPINGNNKPQFVLVFNPFKVAACITSYISKNELYGIKKPLSK